LKRITLLQSNYLPWRGYFDFMAKSDEFIVYDSCQYTVNDWRNRNQVKTRNGVRWITVPVITKGRFGQRITEAEVVDHKWVKTHLSTVAAALGKAEHGAQALDLLRECYELAGKTRWLHEINVGFLETIHASLGFPCRLTDDSQYGIETLTELSPSAKVAELVKRAGGTRYLTGPRGLDYLDPADFTTRDIAIDVLDYSTLGPYPQLYGDFVDHLSVIDLLANTGAGAPSYLTSTVREVCP
jgi:WbqC-like protein family